MTTIARTNREFTLTWTFDTPPEEVFRAWTDPGRLQWFYNPDQPIPSDPIELDLRVGGVWRQRMVIDQERRTSRGACTGRSCPTRSWSSRGVRRTVGLSSTSSVSTTARSSP